MPENAPSLRERRVQLTRDEILRAARRLFADRGYARTSVRDIAQAEGLSAQTVYDSVGSKQALVSRLNDLIDTEAGIGPIARAAAESGGAGRTVHACGAGADGCAAGAAGGGGGGEHGILQVS